MDFAGVPDSPLLMSEMTSPLLESTKEEVGSSFASTLPTVEKAMVLQAELALCRSRLADEAIGRIVAEERANRLDLQLTRTQVLHEQYRACYNIGGMTGSLDYLVAEVADLRDRLSSKQTQSIGTDPPHHPVARSAIPLDRLPDVHPKGRNASATPSPTRDMRDGGVSASSPHRASGGTPHQQRSKFSPQRIREPASRAEAKDVVKSTQEYISEQRLKAGRIPIPTWVVEAPGLKVPAPGGLSRDARKGAVEVALGHFLQELSDTKAIHEMEMKKRETRIEELSKLVTSATSAMSVDAEGGVGVPFRTVPRMTANPAVERVRQRLATLSDDLAQTALVAKDQNSNIGEAKAELQAAKLSFMATPVSRLPIAE